VEDLTDNESEELLRRWWKDNWLWLVGGIVLGLGGLAGWQYWQKSRMASAEQDEASYLDTLNLLDANKRGEAEAKEKALRGRTPGSPYADQGDLALARAAVERGDLAEAALRLRTVADTSKDPQLQQVAKTRLARVLIAQGKPDEALALLDVAAAGSFAAYYHDIRGDALAAKGDAAGARREYASALAASGTEQVIDKNYVELKRDALPAAAAAAGAAK
jgi:predicted negative regulator of RcsB-dependent stress response